MNRSTLARALLILKRKVHKFLLVFLNFSDPLPRGVQLVFKARKSFLSNKKNMCNYSCIKMCDRAGELLKESLNLKHVPRTSSITQVNACPNSTPNITTYTSVSHIRNDTITQSVPTTRVTGIPRSLPACIVVALHLKDRMQCICSAIMAVGKIIRSRWLKLLSRN